MRSRSPYGWQKKAWTSRSHTKRRPKQRLEAERERLHAKSVGQTFVEEVDFGRLLEVAMEGATKAFAAGQQVQQRQQQPAVSVERRAEPESASEASDGSAAAPERSPLAEEMEIDDGDS